MFQTIPNRKHVRQMFAYLDSVTRFSTTHFYEHYQFIQDLHCIPIFSQVFDECRIYGQASMWQLTKRKLYVKNINGYHFQTKYQNHCNICILFQTTNSLHIRILDIAVIKFISLLLLCSYYMPCKQQGGWYFNIILLISY